MFMKGARSHVRVHVATHGFSPKAPQPRRTWGLANAWGPVILPILRLGGSPHRASEPLQPLGTTAMLARMKSLTTHRALLITVLATVLACAWLPWLNDSASLNTEAGLKRSLVTFATARALGAALSVAQGTELSVEPFGVGVTMTPGQMLRPINELVDKFADMMLYASVAFGVQLMLLKFGGHVAVAGALSVAAVLWAAFKWGGGTGKVSRWMQPVLLILLMARFAVPLTSVVSEGIYMAFMKSGYESAHGEVQASARAIPGASPDIAESKGGMLEKWKAWKDKMAALREAAEKWTVRIVDLIVIFVVQTVLIPVAFLWICWRFARAIAVPAAVRADGSTDRS